MTVGYWPVYNYVTRNFNYLIQSLKFNHSPYSKKARESKVNRGDVCRNSGVTFILHVFDLWEKRHRKKMTGTNGNKTT